MYLHFRMVKLYDKVLNSDKTTFPLEQIRTILLIEVQDIGDTIIASPCIRQIRKRFSRAVLHMLVQNKSVDMVRSNPNLNEVFGVPNVMSYPHSSRIANIIISYLQLFRIAKKCRQKHYDLVINLSPSVRNNLIATLSGGKIISGYLNDDYFLPTNYHDHPIEVRGFHPNREITYYKEEPLRLRALKPAAPFGVDLTDYVDTELFLPEWSRPFSDHFLNQHQVQPNDLLIGLHPVSLNDFRNWPPEKFAELGDRLIQHLRNVRIFLIGSHYNQGILALIISLMKQKDHVLYDTTLSIIQTASIINRCHVLIGTDSSPSDISGALKIPTVHMQGPTDPIITGPGGRKNLPVVQGLPCSPCGLNIRACPYDKKCMRELEVSKVFQATLCAIEKYPPKEDDYVQP